MNLEYYDSYEKEFGKIVPPFNRGPRIKKIDIFPLIAYAKIYKGNSDIKRISNKTFVDTESGWVINIGNKKAFRQCKWFYVGYFMNKRAGKRYIFGITANKKVILAGIATHISCADNDQKHKSTIKSLDKGRVLTRKRWNNDLYKAKIFNMWKIDTKLFTFMRNPRRFYPKWTMIYGLAKKIRMFYR